MLLAVIGRSVGRQDLRQIAAQFGAVVFVPVFAALLYGDFSFLDHDGSLRWASDWAHDEPQAKNFGPLPKPVAARGSNFFFRRAPAGMCVCRILG